MVDIIGYIAASLTTFSFVPQVIHTVKTRDTSGISLGMYSILVLGIFLWLVYGFLKGDVIIVVANVATIILSGTVLVIKIKATRKIRSSVANKNFLRSF